MAALQVLTTGIGYGGTGPPSLGDFASYLNASPKVAIVMTKAMPTISAKMIPMLENPMEEASIPFWR
jgi:hypothetical protein